MKAVVHVVYVVMAAWLLVAAALRIALLLRSGSDLDPLPFISGALGLFALIVLLPALEERRERRENPAHVGSAEPAAPPELGGRSDLL